EARNPARALDHFGAFASETLIKPLFGADYQGKGVVLRVIREALNRQRRLRLLYRGVLDPSPLERTIDPRALVYAPRGLYLLGEDATRGDRVLRRFRLDRIGSATVSDEPARATPRFDAE